MAWGATELMSQGGYGYGGSYSDGTGSGCSNS